MLQKPFYVTKNIFIWKIIKSLSNKLLECTQPFVKLFSNIFQKQDVKQLLQCQITIFNKVPGPFKIFRPSSTLDHIVELELNIDNCIRLYKIAHSIHIVIFTLKVVCAFESTFRNGSKLNGDLIFGYSVWLIVFSLGHLMFLFVQTKHADFVNLINKMFTIKPVQNSLAIQLVVWCTPISYVFATFFFLILIIVADIDPVGIWARQNCPVVYKAQKYFFLVYNTWNFSLVTGLICTIMYNGIYLNYIALSVLSTQLFDKFSQESSSLSSFHNGIQIYRQLQLYTELVNSCFENVAFQVKIVYMTSAILLGVVIYQPYIRAMTSTTSFAFCVYVFLWVYFFLTVGYSFPGQCNKTCRNIRWVWKRQIANGL